MSNKLYVGNIPYTVDDSSLQAHFSQAGTVQSAKVITDRASGRSKGFGFVEMSSESEAQTAIDQLNGKELDGRTIRVTVANPPESRDGGGGGRGGRPGGGGGGGFRPRGNGGGGGRGGFRD